MSKHNFGEFAALHICFLEDCYSIGTHIKKFVAMNQKFVANWITSYFVAGDQVPFLVSTSCRLRKRL